MANEAIRLAQQACDATSYQVPKMLGTLAAAYAEQGDFASAVRVVDQAIPVWRKSAMTNLVPELQQRLQ